MNSQRLFCSKKWFNKSELKKNLKAKSGMMATNLNNVVQFIPDLVSFRINELLFCCSISPAKPTPNFWHASTKIINVMFTYKTYVHCTYIILALLFKMYNMWSSFILMILNFKSYI